MRLTKRIAEKINQRLGATEGSIGMFWTAVLVGLVISLLDMLYVMPVFTPAYNGPIYVQLSENPFAFSSDNPFQYRILPALIGYYTGLRGPLFVLLPLLAVWALITAVYFHYRKTAYKPIDALLFTGMVAGSCVVFIPLISPAYTDSFVYLFVFLSFASALRPGWMAFFFGLALLTHECVLFLLPGLLLYSFGLPGAENRKRVWTVIGLLLALSSFFFYRMLVSQFADVKFDAAFYLSFDNIKNNLYRILPMAPAGIFYAFRLLWILPVYLILLLIYKKHYPPVLVLTAILAGTLFQLFFSFDITRHVCLAFPALLIASEQLKKSWTAERFTQIVLLISVFNLLVIPYYASPEGLHGLHSVPYTLLMNFFGI
jgi:hypothetical protein